MGSLTLVSREGKHCAQTSFTLLKDYFVSLIVRVKTYIYLKLKKKRHDISIGSNISSNESDINIHIRNSRTATDRLTTISKSDLTDKIKGIISSCSRVIYYCMVAPPIFYRNSRMKITQRCCVLF